MLKRIFGLWRIVAREPNRKRDDVYRCLCMGCGVHYSVLGRSLRAGVSTQCRSCSKRTHGESRIRKGGPSKERNCLQSIVQRCTNPKHKSYKYYGARGIKITRRWLGPEGFSRFLLDMGRAPTPQHTIERIDNEGPYCKSNCRWATPKEQARNRRDNHVITAFGRSLTAPEWSELTGIPHQTIHSRLRLGWTPQEAVGCRTRSHNAHLPRTITVPT